MFGILAACASNDSSGTMPSEIPNGSTFLPVSGSTFSTDCQAVVSVSMRLQISFSGSHYHSVVKVYSDYACASPQFEIASDTTYAILDGVDWGYMVTADLNATLVSVTAKPQSVQQVNDWNTQSYCGLSNWSLNTVQNISGRVCAGSAIAAAGAHDYDIIDYYKSPDYFGSYAAGDILLGIRDGAHLGDSPSSRPSTYDGGTVYHKL